MDNLDELYRQMADLTLPECRDTCRIPFYCCSPHACQVTRSWAKEKYGIELEETDHPILPFMGERGCTVAPYLRPLCTVHTCDINSFGYKPGDDQWTDRYFALRDKIADLEYEQEVSNSKPTIHKEST